MCCDHLWEVYIFLCSIFVRVYVECVVWLLGLISEMSVMHANHFHLTNIDCDVKLDNLQREFRKICSYAIIVLIVLLNYTSCLKWRWWGDRIQIFVEYMSNGEERGKIERQKVRRRLKDTWENRTKINGPSVAVAILLLLLRALMLKYAQSIAHSLYFISFQ